MMMIGIEGVIRDWDERGWIHIYKGERDWVMGINKVGKGNKNGVMMKEARGKWCLLDKLRHMWMK